jgi:hypothetical protein
MTNNILEKLKDLKIETLKLESDYNLNFFEKLEKVYLEKYLDFVKNNYEVLKHFNDYILNQDNLLRGIIYILLILDQLLKDEENIFSLKIKFFNILNILDKEIKENIYTVYLLSGLYFIYKKIGGVYLLELKKSLIKYFIDVGGIEESIWGLKLNLNKFEDFVKNLDEQKLEKIFTKNKKVSRANLDLLFKK